MNGEGKPAVVTMTRDGAERSKPVSKFSSLQICRASDARKALISSL